MFTFRKGSLRAGPRIRRRRVLIGCMMLAAQGLTACTSWQVTSIQPREFLIHEPAKTIQVREKSGAVYVLEEPRLVGDSLTGYQTVQLFDENLSRAGTRRVEHRLSLDTIDRVGIARFNPLKTLGGVVIAGAIAIVAIGMAMSGYHYCFACGL